MYLILLCFTLLLAGCEDTDVMTATDVGLDAVRALIISDQDVIEIADRSSQYSDKKDQFFLGTLFLIMQ